jgi:NADPH2 dehydrogenase
MSKLFTPITLKSIEVRNRIVMAPMAQYSTGRDGISREWHLVHYTTRAVGGVGLIIMEATAVEPRGRITDHDLGIWSEEHVPGLKRIVDSVHAHGSKIGIQIAHAGRKSLSKKLNPVAPSPIAFDKDFRVPEELSRAEIEKIKGAFAQAASRAHRAGFDMIEAHAAHGYLINEFLSPVTNKRSDEYGGGVEGRVRFLREVLTEVRKKWPEEKPLSVRISAVDTAMELDEMIEIISLLKDRCVDIWHVSSGGISPRKVTAHPAYQVPYSEKIRKTLGVKTIAVGLITTPELAEEVIEKGSSDMVALGRELLRNPYWPLTAASKLGVDIDWPKQYEVAKI